MEDIKEKTCGIEKLEAEPEYARNYLGYVDTNYQVGIKYPTTREMMDKINEIIDYLDSQVRR